MHDGMLTAGIIHMPSPPLLIKIMGRPLWSTTKLS